MARDVAILGVGSTVPRSATVENSARELVAEASTRALRDAGVSPHDVGGALVTAEDFSDGVTTPVTTLVDALAAVQKPVLAVAGDSLQSLGMAVLLLESGIAKIVAVEAHSKISNVHPAMALTHYALDPFLIRPFGLSPNLLAGMEMQRFLHESGNPRETCAAVAVKNRVAGLRNPIAGFACPMTVDDVLADEEVAWPLRQAECAAPVDGAVVLLLGIAEIARKQRSRAVWLEGVGWSHGGSKVGGRSWAEAIYARDAAKRAYRIAGIRGTKTAFQVAEIEDAFAYKELQHAEAIGLYDRGRSGKAALRVARGEEPASRSGCVVNPGGGSLAMGYLGDASGLFRVVEAVRQLRGEAGAQQVRSARRAVVSSWRGIPSASGGVAVLARG